MSDMADRVCALLARGQRARAIDLVYDEVDDRLLAVDNDGASEMLRVLNREDLPSCILMSALTISRPWRAVLGDAWSNLDSALRARGHIMFPNEAA